MQVDLNQTSSAARYERIIQQQKELIQGLTLQNQRLRDLYSKVAKQIQQVHRETSHDPLIQLCTYNQELSFLVNKQQLASYQQQQEQVRIHRRKVLELTRLNQIITSKNIQNQQKVLELTKKCLDLQQQVDNYALQLRIVTKKLQLNEKSAKEGLEMHKMEIKRMQEIIENLEKERNSIFQKQNQQRKYFQEKIEKILRFANEWSELVKMLQPKDQNDVVIQNNQIKQRMIFHEKIIEEVAKELQERKQQLALYKQCHSSQNLQKLTHHTLQNILHQRHKKQTLFKQLLQKYTQLNNNFSQILNQKNQLGQSLSKLVEENKKLTQQNRQVQKIKEQLERYKTLYKRNRQQTEDMVVLMKENQVFHQIMYEKEGGVNYLNRINEEVVKYEKRMEQRQHMNKWANITELIEVNRKLRERLGK